MAYTDSQRRQHIREAQTYLHGLSHSDETLPPLIPDGVYGPNTTSAVLAFQKGHQLRPTGEINNATWFALVDAYQDVFGMPQRANPMFPLGTIRYTLGDNGDPIFFIQGALQALRTYFPAVLPVSSTGQFDEATDRAVRQFQAQTALPISGDVTPDTWAVLLSALDALRSAAAAARTGTIAP